MIMLPLWLWAAVMVALLLIALSGLCRRGRVRAISRRVGRGDSLQAKVDSWTRAEVGKYQRRSEQLQSNSQDQKHTLPPDYCTLCGRTH